MAAIDTLARQIAADPTARAAGCVPVTALSRLEWQVVQIALREADAGAPEATAPRGRVGRWLAAAHRWLTGAQPAVGLADPRLEAVRSFVWAIRRGRDDVAERADALLRVGYTREQVCGMALAGR